MRVCGERSIMGDGRLRCRRGQFVSAGVSDGVGRFRDGRRGVIANGVGFSDATWFAWRLSLSNAFER